MDALDEAVDPLSVAHAVLYPLSMIEDIRVIVGTRRSMAEGPDDPDPEDSDLLVALGASPQDVVDVHQEPDAIARYVTKRLSTAVRAGHLDASAGVIATAAEVISAADGGFLFARLAVHELIASPHLLTVSGLRALLTLSQGGHRDLFGYAVRRLRRQHPASLPLLEALAIGHGRGLPVQDGIWAAIATTLAGSDAQTRITNDDISALLIAAAPYIAVDLEYGHTVYRLAHRTFAEYFLNQGRPQDRHLKVTRRLVNEVENHAHISPDIDLNPYLTQYVSTHAGAGGEPAWRLLARHPRVLDCLDPAAVTADAMRTAFGSFALPVQIAAVVGASYQLAEASPGDRAGLRQLALARRSAQRTVDEPGVTAWSVVWAELRQESTHLQMIGHTNRLIDVVPFTDTNGAAALASSGHDSTVRVWDVSTGTQVGDPVTGRALEYAQLVPVSPAAGPVSRVLVLRTDPKRRSGLVSELNSAMPLAEIKINSAESIYGPTLAAFSYPDGRLLLAVGGVDGAARIWDLATSTQWGAAIREPGTGPCAVTAIRGPDGQHWLAVADDDGWLSGWDPLTLHQVGPLIRQGERPVKLISAMPGSPRPLVVTSDDGRTVEIWDLMTGDQVLEFDIPYATAVAGFVTRSGTGTLATGHGDGSVRTWDLRTGTQTGASLVGHLYGVESIAALLGPTHKGLLATGGNDNTIRIWDPSAADHLEPPLRDHTQGVFALAAVSMPSGRNLLASCGHGTIRIWDGSTGEQANGPLNGHSGSVLGITTLADRRNHVRLASAGYDGTVRIWDLDGQAIGAVHGRHESGANAITTFSGPNGRTLLASGGSDRTVRIWDPVTGAMIGEPLVAHDDAVIALCGLASEAGGPRLVTGGYDGTVRLWDSLDGGPPTTILTGHTGSVKAVTTVATRHRGTLIASCGVDHTVRIWEPGSREAIRTLSGHEGSVNAATTFSTADRDALLATAGHDGTIRTWDPATGEALHQITIGIPVLALATVQPGWLAVGTEEGLVVAGHDVGDGW